MCYALRDDQRFEAKIRRAEVEQESRRWSLFPSVSRILIVLALTTVVAIGVAAGPTAAPAQASCIPQAAMDTWRYVYSNDYNAPPGHIGGREFQNREGKLPSYGNGTYREYDIYPYTGAPRGPERIVVSTFGGAGYYTPDHYNSFERMALGGGC